MSDESGQADTAPTKERIFDFMLKAAGSHGSRRVMRSDTHFLMITVGRRAGRADKLPMAWTKMVVLRMERSCNPEVRE